MKLGRGVEKTSKCWKTDLFQSISAFNSHFHGGENQKLCKM